jgi:hypothetical protein
MERATIGSSVGHRVSDETLLIETTNGTSPGSSRNAFSDNA